MTSSSFSIQPTLQAATPAQQVEQGKLASLAKAVQSSASTLFLYASHPFILYPLIVHPVLSGALRYGCNTWNETAASFPKTIAFETLGHFGAIGLIGGYFAARAAMSKQAVEQMPAQEARPSLVMAVTEETFQQEVLESTLPVVIQACSSKCPPCTAVAPIVDASSIRLEGRVKFVKFDIDEQPSLAQALGILGVPTFLFVKDQTVVGHAMGYMDQNTFLATLGQYLV